MSAQPFRFGQLVTVKFRGVDLVGKFVSYNYGKIRVEVQPGLFVNVSMKDVL